VKPNVFAVIGDIDNVIVRGLPPGFVVLISYVGPDLLLTIERAQHLQGPTKSSQSPGVDIDAVHLKYKGESHDQQPRPQD